MERARWETLDRLLQEVLERPPDEREALVRQLTGGDSRLEADLRSLVRLDAEVDGFLERSAFEVAARAIAAKATADAPTTEDPRIGTTISHYRVLQRIGAGGMGVVYQAEDTRLRRFVALKFLSDEFGGDAEALSRFRREARAVSALNHPGICVIYDIGEQDGHPFHVMEYLEGRTLQHRISEGPIPFEQVVAWAIEISDALGVAHAADIVHRDIKPANIFVTAGNHVKILDFGLARLRRIDGREDVVTEHGTTIGTPVYMSPEQATSGPVDARSDLFSFGLVVYEMSTGVRLVAGVDIRRDLPAGLAAIVGNCLERDPARRYQHASEIRAELGALQDGELSARATAGKADRWTGWRWWAAAIATAAIVTAISARGWTSRPAPVFTNKDTIVLADFANHTRDPIFDGTLRQGLAIQLEQSPFLAVLSDERAQQAMRLMARPADARLDAATAREMCERIGGAAVLEGSIAPLGTEYVLGLQATDCRTGSLFDREQAQARRKEDVLNALSAIVTRFRERAGESLTTVQQHNTPLQDATTASLEAWKAYTAGWRALSQGDEIAALALLRRAIDLDPGFAMAHATLGRIYGNLGESERSLESTKRAYDLRQRTSDHEKFSIQTAYDTQVTEDLPAAAQNCQLWTKTYPRDPLPHVMLAGIILPVFGQYEDAVSEASAALEIDPDFGVGYYLLAERNLDLGRIAAAQTALRRAADRKIDSPLFAFTQYDVAFLNHDAAAMERTAAAGGRSPEQDEMLEKEAFAAAFSGHVRDSRQLGQRALELSGENGHQERAALFQASAAVRESMIGDAALAQRLAADALTASKDRAVEYAAGLVAAFAGDVRQASSLADDLAQRFPKDTSVRVSYLPTLRGLVALKRGHPESAIEVLKGAATHELGTPRVALHGYFGAMYPVYVRALAYLAAHDGARAAAEFQKILDHPGVVRADPVAVVALVHKARALALSHQNGEAQAAYRAFLDAWTTADPDARLLREVKAERERLNGNSDKRR